MRSFLILICQANVCWGLKNGFGQFGYCIQDQHDVITTDVSFSACLEKCRGRSECQAVSFRRMFFECREHLYVDLAIRSPARCEGYMFTSKNTWETVSKTMNFDMRIHV